MFKTLPGLIDSDPMVEPPVPLASCSVPPERTRFAMLIAEFAVTVPLEITTVVAVPGVAAALQFDAVPQFDDVLPVHVSRTGPLSALSAAIWALVKPVLKISTSAIAPLK